MNVEGSFQADQWHARFVRKVLKCKKKVRSNEEKRELNAPERYRVDKRNAISAWARRGMESNTTRRTRSGMQFEKSIYATLNSEASVVGPVVALHNCHLYRGLTGLRGDSFFVSSLYMFTDAILASVFELSGLRLEFGAQPGISA